MSFNITAFFFRRTTCIGTFGLQFHNQSANGNIWLERSHNSHIAQGAVACILDALITE